MTGRPCGDCRSSGLPCRCSGVRCAARPFAEGLMDALSDVLRAVRLTGAVFFDVHASEPWVAETPQGGSIVGAIFPAPTISFPTTSSPAAPALAASSASRRFTCRPATSSSFRTATRTRCPARPACATRRTRRSFAARATGSCRSPFRWATPRPIRRTWSAGFWRAMRGRSTRCCRRCRRSSGSAIARAGRSPRSCSLPWPNRRSRDRAARACSAG